jgi:hypothetical protein
MARNRPFFYFDDAVLVEGDRITDDTPNLLDNPGFEVWTDTQDSHPLNWSVNGQDLIIKREEVIYKSGKYSAGLTTGRATGHVMLDKRLPAAKFAGKTITLGAWIKSDTKDAASVCILDFVQGMHEVTGSDHDGDGKWQFVIVTRAIRPEATGEIVLRLSAFVPFIKEPE